MLFRIEITIKGDSVTLTGLEALEERRRLGLSDETRLIDGCPVSKWVDVDEAFARMYFSRTEREASRAVPRSALMSGEVEVNERDEMIFSNLLSDQRIKDLFVSGVVETENDSEEDE
jgi:hypothetical protein